MSKDTLYPTLYPSCQRLCTGTFLAGFVPREDGVYGRRYRDSYGAPEQRTSAYTPWLKRFFTELQPGQWSALPLKLRQRWFAETDYGRLEPSAELKALIGSSVKTSDTA